MAWPSANYLLNVSKVSASQPKKAWLANSSQLCSRLASYLTVQPRKPAGLAAAYAYSFGSLAFSAIGWLSRPSALTAGYLAGGGAAWLAKTGRGIGFLRHRHQLFGAARKPRQ